MLKGNLEDDKLELEDIVAAHASMILLNEVVWPTFVKFIKNVRENVIRTALFEEGKSKKFSAGYVSALDWLEQLPEEIAEYARQVEVQRKAEDEAAKLQLRLTEGSVSGA